MGSQTKPILQRAYAMFVDGGVSSLIRLVEILFLIILQYRRVDERNLLLEQPEVAGVKT